jgi:hypothetical protein
LDPNYKDWKDPKEIEKEEDEDEDDDEEGGIMTGIMNTVASMVSSDKIKEGSALNESLLVDYPASLQVQYSTRYARYTHRLSRLAAGTVQHTLCTLYS